MPDRNFCSGLLAGAALLVVPCAVVIGLGDAEAAPPSFGSGGESLGDPEVATLVAENQRLRERLDQARAPRRTNPQVEGDPEFVGAGTGETDGPLSAVGYDRVTALLSILRQLDVDGTLERRHTEDPSELFAFVMKQLQGEGRFVEAFDLYRLLEEMGEPSLDEKRGRIRAIGRGLLEQGEIGRAREALLYGLEGTLAGWELLGPLMEVAPEDALAYLDSLTVPIAGLDERRALLFLALDRDEEAMVLLQPLLDSGQLSNEAWSLLAESDPRIVEESLRRLLAKDDLNDRSRRGFEARLDRLLRDTGRSTEVRDRLVAALEASPDDRRLIRRLAEVDRWEAIAWARERIRVSPDSRLSVSLASWLLEEDRSEEALQLLYGLYRERPEDRNVRRMLLQADPEGATRRFVAETIGSTNDEFVGDIADELWQSGRHADAYRLWRRAHELDTNDSEWIGKIVAVDQGRPPI